jgi:hypothetical protein
MTSARTAMLPSVTFSTRTRSSLPLGGTATMRRRYSPPRASMRGLTTQVPALLEVPVPDFPARSTRSMSRVLPGDGP